MISAETAYPSSTHTVPLIHYKHIPVFSRLNWVTL
jgi:hypothetical protein